MDVFHDFYFYFLTSLLSFKEFIALLWTLCS